MQKHWIGISLYLAVQQPYLNFYVTRVRSQTCWVKSFLFALVTGLRDSYPESECSWNTETNLWLQSIVVVQLVRGASLLCPQSLHCVVLLFVSTVHVHLVKIWRHTLTPLSSEFSFMKFTLGGKSWAVREIGGWAAVNNYRGWAKLFVSSHRHMHAHTHTNIITYNYMKVS